jgi:sulfite reductase (ferredoxin)
MHISSCQFPFFKTNVRIISTKKLVLISPPEIAAALNNYYQNLLHPQKIYELRYAYFISIIMKKSRVDAAAAIKSKAVSPKPNPRWGREEETEIFAKKVKLFRQGKISDDDFRRFRLQHGAYGSRLRMDYSMVRIKVPGGEITPEQVEKIASLSEAFSIGSAHVSTRQNIQLHWVQLEDVSEVMRGLVEVGLTTREACGNTVRNVMCSHFAGVCPSEAFDATPYAKAIARFLLRNPMCQNLPRKFKINFSCCDSHGLVRIADIGLVPAVKQVPSSSPSSSSSSNTSSSSSSNTSSSSPSSNQKTTTEENERSDTIRGFKIYLGGGLGAASFIGHLLEDFTPEEKLLATCMATIRLFDRHGNRENMARNRMRYLVHEMGWEKFQRMALKERSIVEMTTSYSTEQLFDVKSHEDTGLVLQQQRPRQQQQQQQQQPNASGSRMMAATTTTTNTRPTKLPMLNGNITKDSPGFERWLHTNAVPQKQEGYFTVFITLGAGDITASQLRVLASAIRDYSAEGVARNTPQQNFALRYVRETDLPNLYERLTLAGLSNPGALTIASAVGCSGTTSCNLAITNSHRLAKEVQRKFLELGLDTDDYLRDATIKISGCPNSCGQHEIATIGFFGGATRMNNTMTPTYTMLFGGSAGEAGELGRAIMRVPAKRVIDTTLKIIELYKNERGGQVEVATAAASPSSGLSDGDKDDNDDSEDKNYHHYETLHQWIIRLVNGQGSGSIKNIEDMKAALTEVTQLPSPEQNSDAYQDYGSDSRFTAKTARGECAA